MTTRTSFEWRHAIFIVALTLLGVEIGIWLLYIAPTLHQEGTAGRIGDEKLVLARQQVAAVRRQVEELTRERDQQLKNIDALRTKLQGSRARFTADLDRALKEASVLLNSPESRSPPIAELARKLVADQDAVRRQLLEMEDELQHIYNRLDGEIDLLRSMLSRPGTSEDEFRELIRRLAATWNERSRDVSEATERLISALNCRPLANGDGCP